MKVQHCLNYGISFPLQSSFKNQEPFGFTRSLSQHRSFRNVYLLHSIYIFRNEYIEYSK